jgi:hypothetical protein
MRRLIIGSWVCLGALCLGVPVSGAAPGDPAVSVPEGTALTVKAAKGKDTAEAKLTLLNEGGAVVRPAIRFLASSSEAVGVESWSPRRIPAGDAATITVQLTGVDELSEAVTGQLVVSGGKVPVSQAIEVVPPTPDESWPVILIFGALAAAIVVAMFVIGAMGRERSRLWNAAPSPKWSFSSWATTLTAAGAVFGTVLGEATFPSVPENIAKPELVNLNILFAALLLVGPFLFEALRVFRSQEAKAGRTGNNFTALLSLTFTLWAVLGQLGAFGLLGWELVGGGDAGRALAIATVFVMLGALWYFFTTASELVLRDWKKEEEEEKEAEKKGTPAPASARAAAWSLP